MKDKKNKSGKAVFSGFPADSNIDIKNVLSSIDRTFLPIGSTIGKYSIIEEIDRGGMAVVYKACQLDLNRIVALKVLPANITINQNFVERFLSEAHAVARLKHQNIINIYEVAFENDSYYLAMEYVPGKNLFYYLNQEKPKLVQVLEITRLLTEALQYAHEQQILHRDLKLNNVIMKDNTTPILIDFGLAKIMGSKEEANLTKTGEIIGSPAYMAPERIIGRELDARSDICSLGIMLYEMLTFKNPYLDPRSMIQTTKNVVEANPVPPRKLVPWLPVEVEAITLKAMSFDPQDRYKTMKEFGEDIHRYQIGEPVIASPPSTVVQLKRFIRKNWVMLVIASIIVCFSALVGVILNIQSGKERSRWQLVVSHSFSDNEPLKDWKTFTGDKSFKTGTWSIADKSLYVESSGFTYIRLERLFTGDILVECDVKAGLKDLFNAGIFIYGSTPDSSYCFHIHRFAEALNGITYPGSKELFYDYKPFEFPVDSQYHVVIEKKDNIVTFWLDEILISRIYDLFPALLKNQHKIGFFVDGSTMTFDNLKIYRRATPRLARPTIVADRFWEQGDFETALTEYREVLVDLSRSNIARLIKFKMADCLIRLNEFAQARDLINSIDNEKKLKEPDKARILFLRSMLSRSSGVPLANNSALTSLAELFPASPENQSIAAYLTMNSHDLFTLNKLDSTEKNLSSLYSLFPGFSKQTGRVSLDLLDYYTLSGKWDKVYAFGNQKMLKQIKDEEVLLHARIDLAKMHLGKREKAKGVDLINRCAAYPYGSSAKWDAWMTLAEIDEFDSNYKDAFTIYKKIAEECPSSLAVSWVARICVGELIPRISPDEKPAVYFKRVIDGSHVFAHPRLIAQLYNDMITEKYFIHQWQQLNPGNVSYFFYLARAAMLDGDNKQAIGYLRKLLKQTSTDSWDYVKWYKLMSRLSILEEP